MGFGHGGAAFGVIALVVSAAFLVWVGAQTTNPYQKAGKAIAWIAVVASAFLLIGQAIMCAQCNVTGKCARMMKGPMGMWHGGMMPPSSMEESGQTKEKK